MEFGQHRLNCDEANRIDLVSYLATLGYQPNKVRGNNYWYLSMLPDRIENTPSFKVNKNRNTWYDFGIGEGGTLIDFGIRYHKCGVSDLLKKLYGPASYDQNVPPPRMVKEPGEHHPLTIVNEGPIRSERLVLYLKNRRIPFNVAQHYLSEVTYSFKGKYYLALGFQNDLGGYEMRNEFFKNGTAPKTIRSIPSGASDKLMVFEGFFDFLSYMTALRDHNAAIPNFLVLNSLAFIERARPFIDVHKEVNLFLDRDLRGIQATQNLVKVNRHKFFDRSDLYKGYKDLNEWICHIGSPPEQRPIQTPQKRFHP